MLDLDGIDPATRTALADYAARIKHDLGKYVAFQMRWLADDAPFAERKAALIADLCSTRRGPEGTRDAPSLWADLRPALVGEEPLPGGRTVDLSDSAVLHRLDAAMGDVVEVVGLIDDDALDAAALERGALAARRVADACRDLVRQVRRG